MIAIIDYGIGNLGSVLNALKFLNFEAKVTSNKEEILAADKVILPGVGAFSDAMNSFIKQGFDEVIAKLIEKNTPILGICVGMQMLFEYSYEYDWHNALDNHWELIDDFDSGRFKCLKKYVLSEVEKAVNNKLKGDTYKNLKIKITDKYITTDCEV